jgi:hypothetical protein
LPVSLGQNSDLERLDIYLRSRGRTLGVQASAQPSRSEVPPEGLPAPAPIQFIDTEHALAVVDQEECSSDGAYCTYLNGLYLSDDGGRSWHPAPERP